MKTKVPKRGGTVKPASLRPRDMVDDADVARVVVAPIVGKTAAVLAGIRGFNYDEATETKDLGLSRFPDYVYEALQVLVAATDRSMSIVMAYSIGYGLELLKSRCPEILIIATNRLVVQQRAPRLLVLFNQYSFKVGDGNGRIQRRWTTVSKDLRRDLNTAAERLGLSPLVGGPSVVAVLSIEATCLDAFGILHRDYLDSMDADLARFLAEQQARVTQIIDLRDEALKTEAPDPFVPTWMRRRGKHAK